MRKLQSIRSYFGNFYFFFFDYNIQNNQNFNRASIQVPFYLWKFHVYKSKQFYNPKKCFHINKKKNLIVKSIIYSSLRPESSTHFKIFFYIILLLAQFEIRGSLNIKLKIKKNNGKVSHELRFILCIYSRVKWKINCKGLLSIIHF